MKFTDLSIGQVLLENCFALLGCKTKMEFENTNPEPGNMFNQIRFGDEHGKNKDNVIKGDFHLSRVTRSKFIEDLLNDDDVYKLRFKSTRMVVAMR